MISVIIPAYNEEENIREIIERSLPFADELIVVNDGSKDRTRKILDELKNENGLKIIDINLNSGKSNAIREGIKHATSDIVVFLDADLQHLPEEIPKIVEPIMNNKADLVIGNRKSRDMPIHRMLSNLLVTKLCCLKTKNKINDIQCGFRAIKKSLLDTMELNGERYIIETSMYMESCRKGFKIMEVPVNCIYNGSNSKINVFKDSFNFIRYIIFNR